MNTPADTRWIDVAAVVRPHGVRGELRLHAFSETTTALKKSAKVRLTAPEGVNAEPRDAEITRAQQHKPQVWIVSLHGVSTIEQAELLRSWLVQVPRDALEDEDDDEFYVADAIGCAVFDHTGARVGEVTDVIAYPSVDALVVRGEGERVWEVPCVEGIVHELDIDARRVVVDGAQLEDFVQS